MCNNQFILPEEFYKEEVRSGYVVREIVKKAWALELEMYDFFKKFCNKYNIKFWADGGTLLGAVRHNGFIPWDTDMDIMVLRKDYDFICENFQKEINDLPYFFQTSDTDNTSKLYGKLRYNDTEILSKDIKPTKHMGICIDIFPFDYLPDNEKKAQKQILQVMQLFKIKKNPEARKYLLKIMTQENKVPTNTVCNLSVSYHKGCIKYKEDFLETIDCKFENTTIPIPKGYDRVLTDLYDNWHEEINDGHDKKIIRILKNP